MNNGICLFCLFLTLLWSQSACSENNSMVLSKSYIEHLSATATFKVTNYEQSIFKGWTLDDAVQILTPLNHDISAPELPKVAPIPHLPSSISWTGDCNHSVREQLECGAGWAFAVAGMLSDICCHQQGHDYGWLSPQELISCDEKSHGCDGGWPTVAVSYVNTVKGLVPDECYPYTGQKESCPATCKNGNDWEKSHVCNCIGGYKRCEGVQEIKTCLQKGPITLAMGICRSFYAYGGGIYICDCRNKYLGIHVIEIVGFGSHPVCYWLGKNSWGPKWGEDGYFKIACKECGIDGEFPNGNLMCDKVK